MQTARAERSAPFVHIVTCSHNNYTDDGRLKPPVPTSKLTENLSPSPGGEGRGEGGQYLISLASLSRFLHGVITYNLWSSPHLSSACLR